MIISRTPFRISFAGGGSDISSFYTKEMGAVLSTTIDKYMYIAIHPFFDPESIQLKYSRTELVSDIEDIQHPIFRTVLDLFQLKGVDINSIADIPSGTGLGSSSSFTVGLLNAIKAYQNSFASAGYLASKASNIEIDLLKSPIGKQDQYAAAFGGLNFITFYGDEQVSVEKIIMSPSSKKELEKNLILIYTGEVRSANTILKKQNNAIREKDKFETQKKMVELAFELKESLEKNDIDYFGRILHEGWMLKRSLVKSISNNLIDDVYDEGMKAGALGGKLLGAGGGGFLLFYCPLEKQDYFKKRMNNFKELKFNFDHFGSKIIYIGNDDEL